MQYIFTKKDFYPEYDFDNVNLKTKDKFLNLYNSGLNDEKIENMSSSEKFLISLSRAFFNCLTNTAELELLRDDVNVNPTEEVFNELLESLPYTLGSEYVSEEWIANIFLELLNIFKKEIKKYKGTVAEYFATKNSNIHIAERIFFNLVKNKNGSECFEYPFVFMATYSSLDKKGKIHQVPLKFALTEFKNEKQKMLNLLSCINRAADKSKIISEFVKSGEMLHPLRITKEDAYKILLDIEEIEKVGILCRIPNWWRKKYCNPTININFATKSKAILGLNTILSIKPVIIIDGVELTKAEIKKLLEQAEGLALIKGKWIEVNHNKLKELLNKFNSVPDSMTLLEAIHSELLGKDKIIDVGLAITNKEWIKAAIDQVIGNGKKANITVPKSVNAILRPYQVDGFNWLNNMSESKFGACLADDMGLGKTLQVLTYLERMRLKNNKAKNLLIVPASLLDNWKKEASKFTPDIDLSLLYGKSTKELNELIDKKKLSFLNITTYGMSVKLENLKNIKWDTIILDEAQAIKNPVTKQTKKIKELNADMKIIMTGTPIENNLSNLWSLFDFINHGLLGTSNEFKAFNSSLEEKGYTTLKNIVSPFILRRLKTDKNIISDLPDKNEIISYVTLSKKQKILYTDVLNKTENKILNSEGIEKKGVVLSTILKLKQICNHPDQYLGDTTYDESESGKFEVLKELCETIYEKRERVLVFTQYQEITKYLSNFLKEIFNKEGFVLTGSTKVKDRAKMVDAFQSDDYIPYMVLSLKAGGTGLNLTNANNVIHFDRWWNPAVENQATDRAFRIGQDKNVMVYKFVTSGTIEEKIDEMINSKKQLAEDVIGGGTEKWITEMSNEEIMNMLRLEN